MVPEELIKDLKQYGIEDIHSYKVGEKLPNVGDLVANALLEILGGTDFSVLKRSDVIDTPNI